MITIKIVFLIVCVIAWTIYFVTSTVALIDFDKTTFSGWYPKSGLLISTGFTSFLVLIVFILSMLNSITSSTIKEEPRYELIQEPVYRQIK